MARLRLLSWNVNGLRAAHRKSFLEWFRRERPDVLCLQETKAAPARREARSRELEGYRARVGAAVAAANRGRLSRKTPSENRR